MTGYQDPMTGYQDPMFGLTDSVARRAQATQAGNQGVRVQTAPGGLLGGINASIGRMVSPPVVPDPLGDRPQVDTVSLRLGVLENQLADLQRQRQQAQILIQAHQTSEKKGTPLLTGAGLAALLAVLL